MFTDQTTKEGCVSENETKKVKLESFSEAPLWNTANDVHGLIYWTLETSLLFLLIIPKYVHKTVQIKISATNTTIILAWKIDPPFKIFTPDNTGLVDTFLVRNLLTITKEVVLKVKEGEIQPNQSLWVSTRTPEFSIFRIPKVASITLSESDI